MNRAHAPQTLPLMLMMSAAVWAAHAGDHHSGTVPQTISGAYAVTFNVKAPSTVAAGAAVTCKARIAPRLSTLEKLGSQAVPVESAPGVARLVGSSANCTVIMPFSFAEVYGLDGADLSYEIDALSGTSLEAVRKQDGILLPYPQAGATASLRMDVNF